MESNLFVHADGVLAEWLCHARVIGLTPQRAEHLLRIHGDDPPGDCPVHLAALQLLTEPYGPPRQVGEAAESAADQEAAKHGE
ncbi:hypothetical protein [Nocardia thraciensis]